ncbi:MAG: hypothetical protein AAB461_00125 [Patescibacteria group bacterium]
MEKMEKHHYRKFETPELVFELGGDKLYVQNLENRMVDRNGQEVKSSVATYGGPHTAIIDRRAYEMLKQHCGENKVKFDSYLEAIMYFEIHHSDDEERHQNREPVEEEILDVLKEQGYFDKN